MALELIANALNWLANLVWWASLLIAGLLILRMIVHWMKLNPFSAPVYNLRRWTEPLVRPLRASTGSIMSYDLIPLVMAILVATTGLFLSNIISRVAFFLVQAPLALRSPHSVAVIVIQLAVFFFTVMIFIRIVILMFNISYYNRFARFTYRVTEPILRPLRRFLVRGMFDFSPLVALLLIQFAGWILLSIVDKVLPN